MIGIGVIGTGYWGPNLVRNFAEAQGARVVAVSDLVPSRLASIQARYPGVRTTADHMDLVRDPRVDAVAIATPVSTHHALGMAVLREGKHLLVTKPMAASPAEAEELVAEAERRRLVLLVDHTFVYTGAVQKIRSLVADGELGDICYYDAVRVNLGLFQHDVDVAWDLAVHDFSILDYVLPLRPQAVAALGISHVEGRPNNVAYVTLLYAEKFIAHVHVSWLAPVKIRRTLLGGMRKMIVFDDLEPSEKVKIYDSGITVTPQGGTDPKDVYKLLIDYRAGDMWAPKVGRSEALRVEADEFVDCVTTGRAPTSDGAMGLRMVRILDAATRSMRRRGEPVEL